MQEDQDNNSLSSKSLIALIALDKEAFLKQDGRVTSSARGVKDSGKPNLR
jgi:hypothetical protein